MRLLQAPSSRWLAGAALAVLAVVIVSVVLALVRRPAPALRPEDTPEGVVQRYLLALKEDDNKTAYGYLSRELQRYCTASHFLDSTRWLARRDMRVTLKSTEELNGEAQVWVKITEMEASPPFGIGQSSYDQRFTLEREDGAWRFSEPPWPAGWCPGWEEQKRLQSTPSKTD